MTPDRARRLTGLGVAAGVAAMTGLSFAAVPLYDLLCRVTGLNGTTQVAAAAPAAEDVRDRVVTVRFDADIASSLPWEFGPEVRSVKLRAGEAALIHYRATNLSNRPTTGTAIYSVSPPEVGGYFAKVECFCFIEQTLQPGESIDMPVSFFVMPEFADNPELDAVRTITLSYTFYPGDATAPSETETAAAGSGDLAATQARPGAADPAGPSVAPPG